MNFVAVMINETIDVSNKFPLSTTFPYVTSEGKVQKRFLGFSYISSKCACLSHILFEYLDQFNHSVKLVAKTYNWAQLMSGSISGPQSFVKEKYSETKVMFVCFCAYRLNFCLQK